MQGFRPIRAKLATLGCRVNQSESAMIEDALVECGVQIVRDCDFADLLVVNSCALTEIAEAKTRRAIKNFKRKNPGSKVCVTGCYAQTNPQSLLDFGVDMIVSNADKKRAAQLSLGLFRDGGNSQPINTFNSFEGEVGALKKSDLSDSGFVGNFAISDRMNLKIQDGCNNACAYCIIPRARGLPRSRRISEILSDAKNLVSRGVRELVLTGINISKFDGSIADLVEQLSEIKGLLRIGIGSLEPPVRDVERLVNMMACGDSKLAKHFHISLQSASDKVLSAMRRKYTVSEFFRTVDFIKSIDSDISVGTDLICGFPGESEEDFDETLRNVGSSKLSFLHVFTYSPRPQTLAALKKQLPFDVRRARADRLRLVGDELRDKFFKSQIGKTCDVLLENQLKSGDYLGYTQNYIQVAVSIADAGLKNTMCRVKIVSEIGKGRMRAERI